MRGKGYKAAVQAYYKQRGWQKREEEHWRDLGPAVGLFEDDEQDQWSRVLALSQALNP